MTRRTLLALSLLPLAALPARSQTTPAQADALKAQIQDWVAAILGPDVPAPTLPLQITSEGDHYNLVIPFGSGPDAPQLTGEAKGPDNGRWTIDNIALPSPAEFHFDMPAQSGGATTYTFTVGEQNAEIQFDPSLQTASTSTSTLRNFEGRLQNEKTQQESHFDLSTSTMSLQPSSGGRVNLAAQGHLEGYRMRTAPAGTGDAQMPPTEIGIGSGDVQLGVMDASPDRIGQLIRLAGALSRLNSQAADQPSKDQAGQALLAAFADVAQGMSLDENLQNLSLGIMGMEGALHTARLGIGIKGQGGLVEAYLAIGAEGLTLPDLGLGPLQQLIPTKLTLRPTVSNLPSEAVTLFLQHANDKDVPPELMQALFSHGPVVVGLENLTLDVAGSELTGLAKVTIANPADVSGTGQIAITNLDALQQQISSQPMLQQGLPVLIFLKGIGRVNGNQTVWDLSFQNGKLLVNGTDMSALTGGPPPGAAPQAPAPRQPQQPQPQLRRRP